MLGDPPASVVTTLVLRIESAIGLAVVYAHDGHNRWTGLEVSDRPPLQQRPDRDLLELSHSASADDRRFVFNALGERCHDAQPHEPFDQLSAADRQLFLPDPSGDGLRQVSTFFPPETANVVSPAPGQWRLSFLPSSRKFFSTSSSQNAASLCAGGCRHVDLFTGRSTTSSSGYSSRPIRISHQCTHMVTQPQFNEEVHEDFTLNPTPVPVHTSYLLISTPSFLLHQAPNEGGKACPISDNCSLGLANCHSQLSFSPAKT